MMVDYMTVLTIASAAATQMVDASPKDPASRPALWPPPPLAPRPRLRDQHHTGSHDAPATLDRHLLRAPHLLFHYGRGGLISHRGLLHTLIMAHI